MSMFYCSRCAQLRDSDDGCEEVLGRLLCSYCGDEVDDEEEEREPDTRGEARQSSTEPPCERCGGTKVLYTPGGRCIHTGEWVDDDETPCPDCTSTEPKGGE